MQDQPGRPQFVQGPDIVFLVVVTSFTFMFLYWLRKDNVSLTTLAVASIATGLGQTLLFKWISRGRTRRKW